MKKLSLLLLSFCSAQFLFGQNAPGIEWEKSLGGTDFDEAYSIQETSDGEFVVAGRSRSNDDDVSGNHGGTDVWIVKLDTPGNLVWEKSLGGLLDDEAFSIQQTTDGGFIVAGNSYSNNGDVSGNHGDADYWIVKLGSNGNLVWQKSLGGTDVDYAYSIQQTFDGGFIIAGYSTSNDGDVSGNHGSYDCWIVRLDTMGNLIWQKSLGGSGSDFANSIQQTTDGGFIVACTSNSNDSDVTGNHGYYTYYGYFFITVDYWVMKLDSTGNLLWQGCFGGSYDDAAYSIQQTFDGGFIVAGTSSSSDGDVSGHHWLVDSWIVKLDSTGNLMGQESLGGNNSDYGYSVRQTADSGFIIAGWSNSYDGDVSANNGSDDYWIVKLSPEFPTVIKTPNSTFSFSISPNPSAGNLQITLPTSLHQPTTLSITNLLGQKLFEEEIPANTSQQSFDLSDWQKGMYFITLRDENSFGEKQLVIQ